MALCWIGLSGAIPPSPAAATTQALPETPGITAVSTDDALAQAWAARMDELGMLTEKAAEVQGRLQDMRTPLQQGIRDARAEMQRLRSLYRAAYSYPVEQTNVARQLRGLQTQFLEMIRPLGTFAVSVTQWLAQVDKQQQEINALLVPSSTDKAEGTVPADNKSLTAFRTQLADARKQLNALAAQVRKLSIPADATKESLSATVTDMEKTLPDVWKEYYLPEYTRQADTPLRVEPPFGTWLTSLSGRLSYALPQSMEEWGGAARRFFVTLAAMAGLAFLGGVVTRALPAPWDAVSRGILTGSWVWIGLGLSLLIGAVHRHGGVYPLLTLPGALALAWGLTSVGRRLRAASTPALHDTPSPLYLLYIPAALGTVLLFLDPPAGMLNLAWGILLTLGLAAFFLLQRGYATRKRPLPEPGLWSSVAYGSVPSLLCVWAGYGRFSILLLIALFALCSFVVLGKALATYAGQLVDNAFDKEKYPVRNTVGRNLSGPAAWIAALACAAPWLWAVPGVRYMLPHMFHLSYTVGQATFDSSRIISIVVLFFVFRLLTALCRVGLDRLPDSFAHLERGAIPPFKSFITYALWIFYIAIALETLGVNLTSLTVIAGGLSVGLGFGMQNIFNNLVSGLLLIFGRNILVGDVIGISNTTGTVREVNIRSTTVETAENALVYIPNSSFMTNQLTNWSRTGKNVEKILSVSAPESLDFATLSDQLLAAAGEQQHISAQPAPRVLRSPRSSSDDGRYQASLVVFVDYLSNAATTMEMLRQKISDLPGELVVREA